MQSRVLGLEPVQHVVAQGKCAELLAHLLEALLRFLPALHVTVLERSLRTDVKSVVVQAVSKKLKN